jgi:hypothetical protein
MSELWQQASVWLRALDVLQANSQALKPTARVYDLALALQVQPLDPLPYGAHRVLLISLPLATRMEPFSARH